MRLRKWKLTGLFIGICMGLLIPGLHASAQALYQAETVYEISEAYQKIYTPEYIRAFEESQIESHTAGSEDEIPYFSTYEDLVAYVKTCLLDRKQEVYFTIPYSIDFSNIVAVIKKEIVAEAAATSCREGDYLLANIVGYKYHAEEDYENDCATHYVDYFYTSTAEQEKEVDAMIPQVLASFSLDGKTDYEKIKIIHDYLVDHITYTNNNDYECHSTYAALIKGEAVCQGYASLFYRLCKEIGIECRYVVGTAFEPHAWNIVKLEGKWYNMDCTWDDRDNGNIYYNCFLKSEDEFYDHERYSQYTSDEFMAQYPMSDVSYLASTVKELEEENLSVSFHTTTEEEITSDAADTEKILYFYDMDNGRCIQQLKDYVACDWIKDCEFVAIDGKGNDKSIVADFKNSYVPEHMTFCYDTSGDVLETLKSYCEMAGMEYNGFFPYIVLIDRNNMVRKVVSGYYAPDALQETLESLKEDEQPPIEPTVPVQPTEPAVPQEPNPPIVPDKPVHPQPVPATHPFADVPESGWKAEAVSYVYHNGIMNGISGTNLFDPDNTLTRGMFATILYRMAGSPAVVYDKRFKDVPDGKWYSDAIIWASQQKIVSGFSDGTYGVNAAITREQLIKMIGLYALQSGYPAFSDNDLSAFEDTDSISDWAKSYVGWAVDSGIISGKPTMSGGYRVDPKGTATRAECAKMVSKYLGLWH